MLSRPRPGSRHRSKALSTCDEALGVLSGFDKGTSADILRLKAELLAALGRETEAATVKTQVAALDREIADELRESFPIFYDDSGAIGRRYRRQDEVGTPFGITIDGESLTNSTVTVRDRDRMTQDRVPIPDVAGYVRQRLAASMA